MFRDVSGGYELFISLDAGARLVDLVAMFARDRVVVLD